MKIAFVGKGGSGKTTLAALFARHLAEHGRPVLAIDADINQHLAVALGVPEHEATALPALGDHIEEIKQYLRGDNPRIGSTDAMVKTTPPGAGSRLVDITGHNPIYQRSARDHEGIRLLVTGPFTEDDLGVACYHSKVGAVELLLNHLVDGAGEYVVVDMTAGADSFASGLFTRFDITFCVCEPTWRGVSVFRQYMGYAAEFGVRVAVVGNKMEDDQDAAFLRDALGVDPVACLSRSAYVRATEQSLPVPGGLEATNRAALAQLQQVVDTIEKDWPTYTRQAVEFHLRNANAWANARVGIDLSTQVDPDFVLGPGALTGS